MKEVVHDTTDSFDQRLDVLQAGHALQVEIDAAIAVYERLRTAQTICQALVPGAYSDSEMLVVLKAITDEVALATSIAE